MGSKRKSTKAHINWTELIVSAIVDLIVGIILVIVSELFK